MKSRSIARFSPRRPVAPDVASQVTILMLTVERLARRGHGDLVIDAVAHALGGAGYRERDDKEPRQ